MESFAMDKQTLSETLWGGVFVWIASDPDRVIGNVISRTVDNVKWTATKCVVGASADHSGHCFFATDEASIRRVG